MNTSFLIARFRKMAVCVLAGIPLSLFAIEGNYQMRAGYFQFANHTAREIYGLGAPDIELQGDVLIHILFNPWINLNYVWKEGKTEALSSPTRLQLGTLSLGSNFHFRCYCRRVRPYLGVGITAAYLNVRDYSDYVPQHTHRWSVGVVGKSGVKIHFCQHLFLDLFFDYYYQPVNPRDSIPEHQVNVGGFRTGLGLGF